MAEVRGRRGIGKGSMTVEDAGRKGGQRVRELIEEGKKAEGIETRKIESKRSEDS